MIRVIARIEIQNGRAVKGRRCEGVRPVGDPAEMAARYYDDGADEVFVQDVGASLYGDEPDYRTLERIASALFVPLVVAGGIASTEQARRALELGAERVAVNTAAIEDPALVPALADRFGASAVTVLIEAKRHRDGVLCHVRGGRERSRFSVSDHMMRLRPYCAEVAVCSVDHDGDTAGPDTALSASLPPHVAMGGIRTGADAVAIVRAGAQAVAVASALHDGASVQTFKQSLRAAGYEVRA